MTETMTPQEQGYVESADLYMTEPRSSSHRSMPVGRKRPSKVRPEMMRTARSQSS